MTANTERVKRIEKRWTESRKISGADVDYLIRRARATDTMEAANTLRKRDDPLADLFGFNRFGGSA